MRIGTNIALLAVLLLVIVGFSPLPESLAARLRALADAQSAAAPSSGAAVAPAGPASAPAVAADAALTSYAVRHADRHLPAVELGSALADNATYPLGLSIDSLGAGIDSVTLNKFRQTVAKPGRYVYETPLQVEGLSVRPLAVQTITLATPEGAIDFPTSDYDWLLDSAGPGGATYSVIFHGPHSTDPRHIVLRVTRRYQVVPQAPAPDKTQGYEIRCSLSFQSFSDRPLQLQATMNGPTPPRSEQDRFPERQLLAGFDDAGVVKISSHYVDSEFTAEKPQRDLLAESAGKPLLWFGTCSNYFDAIVRLDPSQLQLGPSGSAGGAPTSGPTTQTARSLDADYVGSLTGHLLNPDSEPAQHQVQVSFMTAPLTVPPGATLTLPMRVFFGPKQRSLLNGDYYSAYPLSYQTTLQTTSSFCANCAPTALINVLVALLGMFHVVTRDWGLAIVGLVCMVRLILHPIMKRSQANMMRMGKMGPEIEKLKQKYGDDKEAMGKAQMQLMKQQGIGPLLGCLPLFLQAPIFISLYTVLQTTFELRHAPFLYGLTWIKDLAQPDRAFYFPNHPLEIWHFHLDAINVLPILTGILSFISQKINQKSMPRALTPEQAQQQKMMQWMTLLFPLIMYNLPSGLNLYYLASTGIGLFEAQAIRKHIQKQEAKEKAERPTVIDVKPSRASKLASRTAPKDEPPKRGIRAWLANMQEQADQLRRDAEKRKRKT